MFTLSILMLFSTLYADSGASGQIELCVGDTRRLECKTGELMMFDEAMFGVSDDASRCSYKDGDCRSSLEFQQAQLKCFGRQNCTLELNPRTIICRPTYQRYNVTYYQANYQCFSESSRQDICASDFSLRNGSLQIMNTRYPEYEQSVSSPLCNCTLRNPRRLPIQIILVDFEIPYSAIGTVCPVKITVQDETKATEKCVFQGTPWLAEVISTNSTSVTMRLDNAKYVAYKIWISYKVQSGDPSSVVLECGTKIETTTEPTTTTTTTTTTPTPVQTTKPSLAISTPNTDNPLTQDASTQGSKISTGTPTKYISSENPIAAVTDEKWTLFGLTMEIIIVIGVAIVAVIIIIIVVFILLGTRNKRRQKKKSRHVGGDMNNRLYSKVDNRKRVQNGAYANPAFDSTKYDDVKINTVTSTNNEKSDINHDSKKPEISAGGHTESTEDIHTVSEITLVINDISGLPLKSENTNHERVSVGFK